VGRQGREVGSEGRRGTRAISLSVVAALAAGVLALIAIAPPAGAAKALANLKVTFDDVQIKQKGKSSFVAARDGMTLKQGDTIKTDADGRAEIDYTDGSLTRLGGSTIFTISKLTDERGARQTQGTLTVGEAWNRAAKVSETGAFEVKAGGTTAAVEGTAFVAICVPRTDSQRVDCTFTAVVDDIKVDSDLWDVTDVTDAP
jgi:FecR protein